MASLLLLVAVTSAHAAPPHCAHVLAVQVWLDRQGFSSGVIDGKMGMNTTRALRSYREARGVPRSVKGPDCPTTTELLQAGDLSGTTTYQVTSADAAGPFQPLPKRLPEQAGRSGLGYESLLEKLAERFHAAPALLQSLNPATAIAAGMSLIVPNVAPFDSQVKPARASSGAVTVDVTRHGELRVRGVDNSLLFYAPASSGSQHDPLPAGQWKVTGVTWMPRFHYNPDLFWDAEGSDKQAMLAPGPNNPVGVVWIDIDVKHYGVHGTPDPSRIGYAQSHGCVRLTNWDAAKLASLVAVGTPVRFQ